MPLYTITNGSTGWASDINQALDAISGENDVDITVFAPIAAPAAPTVAVNATAGTLTGAYKYAVALITGYWQGPTGTGTLLTEGNTGGGTASATVSPSAQQVNLTNIPIGGTGVVARIIYRTKAGGATYYQLVQISDNTTTAWTDNVADASLVTVMPATNTTGSKFVGDGSGLTNIPVPVSSVNNKTGVVVLDPADVGAAAAADLITHLAETASETVKGHVELATAAETTTGTDNTRAVHPAGLKVELDKKLALALLTTQGDIPYATGTSTWARLAKGLAYQVLGMNSGATAPQYMASLQSLITAAGDLIVGSAANTPAKLAIGTALQQLRVNAGATASEWFTPTPGAQVASGSYTGDSTTSRTITVGFRPKFLYVMKSTAALLAVDDGLASLWLFLPTTYMSNDHFSGMTSTGFITGSANSHMNTNASAFKWIAVG